MAFPLTFRHAFSRTGLVRQSEGIFLDRSMIVGKLGGVLALGVFHVFKNV
jgi:hypothetical protein